MRSIAVAEIVDRIADRLALEWVAGRAGAARRVDWDDGPQSSARSLVGHFNLIHPNQVQVLGPAEITYLDSLKPASRAEAIDKLLALEPAAVVMTDASATPAELRDRCEALAQPLFATDLAGERLVEELRYYLGHLLARAVTLHGVYLEVSAIGVLLTGPPGVGKSELALELITRGHRLVADDAVQFARIAPDIIDGTCPPALADFLEVRGIGVVNVRQLFGDGALKANKYLRLIIELQPLDPTETPARERLQQGYRTRSILDLDVPEITLPVAPGRNLSVLVECAARNHILRMNGYNATEDFVARQATMLEAGRGG